MAGCATLARYLVLILLGGFVMVFGLFLARGNGLFPTTPRQVTNAGTVGATGGIPPISKRFFGSGKATANVSGDFTLMLTDRPLDDEKSYSDGDLTWIAYGKTNPTILISLGEDENSVAVSDGTRTALGVNSQCQFRMTVTKDSVTGKITCEHAQLIEDGKPVGTIKIEISKFDAATIP